MGKLFSLLSVFLLTFVNVQAGPPLQLERLQGGLSFNDNDNSQLAIIGARLPTSVIPSHYNLEIRPILDLPETDPDQFTAPGTVSIWVTCVNSTNEITLHSNEITIQHASVTVTSATTGTPVVVTGYTNDSSLSMYTVILATNLTVNQEYVLTIPFTSLVGNRLSGLYRSSYVDSTGTRKWLATTQFQKLGARMAFPCFDEPALKATFNITIGRTTAYTSLCNAPLASTTPIPGMTGWVWDAYGTTVKMSSYLVAMIVSDFTDVEAPAELSQYTVKIWGPPNMVTEATGDFSSKAAARILTYFENYFNSTYQFPKLDSVGIPDFSAGAMENWALNTYRVVLLLWFEGESTQFELWRQAFILAHEISHHWWGDLVTCSWWNDLWLNEGFANYMEFLGANASGTDFGALDRYVIDVIQLAMEFDATAGSEPIHSSDLEQVVSQPSRIVYEKGGSLIRMMQSFLTENTLIQGLRNYLDKHQYSSTVQDDLFVELQAQAEADGTASAYTVKEIMDTWTMKTGFPLIRVSRATPGSGVVYLSQERFLLPGAVGNDTSFWYVPISYATKGSPDFSQSNWQPKLWMNKDTIATSLILDTTEEWLIVNPDARHYYRVIYDEHFFSLIQAQLELDHTVFSLSSRSQIIDDYFKSAFADYINIQTALNLTRYLGKEDENSVWTSVFNNLRQPYNYLRDTVSGAPFKAYILQLVEPVLSRVGWEQSPTDSPATVFLRIQLLDWACSAGSVNCSTTATTLVNNWLADPVANRIPADVQPVMFCHALSAGDASTSGAITDALLTEYKKLTNATRDERQLIFINALSCHSNVASIESLLAQTISDISDVEKSKHGVTLVQRISENSVGRSVAFNFLTANVEAIRQTLGETAISSIITSISTSTTDTTFASQVVEFIDLYLQRTDIPDSVRQSLGNSRNTLETGNPAWINKYAQLMTQWFESQVSK